MANLLDTMSPEQLDDLAAMIDARRGALPGGKKIDFNAMPDKDRWEYNKTLTPATNKIGHEDYPRVLYGMREGKLVQVTVEDRAKEEIIREQYPYGWAYSMRELGVETCPTHGDGISAVDFTPPTAPPLEGGLDPAKFAQGVIQSQEAAGKRGPGRPRKTA